ncbi:hypothetical protein [Microlunatus parietis]|uniref:hypothetical protein n=1 Tax=Microlunatus parietis TaxID=682979 RepID=UPI0015C8CD03|nr:hypothetical protein [Microlunatus parietis]
MAGGIEECYRTSDGGKLGRWSLGGADHRIVAVDDGPPVRRMRGVGSPEDTFGTNSAPGPVRTGWRC